MIFEVINESASPVPSSGGFFQPAAVLKFEVCHDDIVKKPSKTPTTMLIFNDLRLSLHVDIV
jgi:hypothetical protein